MGAVARFLISFCIIAGSRIEVSSRTGGANIISLRSPLLLPLSPRFPTPAFSFEHHRYTHNCQQRQQQRQQKRCAFFSSLVPRGGTGSLRAINSNEEEEEPRTGWLHNTEPKVYTASSSVSAAAATAKSSPTATSLPLDSSSASSPSPGEKVPKKESRVVEKETLIRKMKRNQNHRIINPPTIHPCGDHQRMAVTEHKIAVPLSHLDLEKASSSDKDGRRIAALDRVDGLTETDESSIDVYFSVIERVSNSNDEKFFESLADTSLTPQQRAQQYIQRSSAEDGGASSIDPSRMILYLQGGPGFGCAAPVSGLSLASSKSSWAAEALLGGATNLEGKSFERVVLMDQRGTGKSAPVTKQRLQKLFPDLFLLDEHYASGGTALDDPAKNVDIQSDTETFRTGTSDGDVSSAFKAANVKVSKALSDAVDYLSKLRADSIVRDAELVKEALVHPFFDAEIDYVTASSSSPQPWGAVLGQSFGGFCLMTYLSSFTHPPQLCLFTGGIAPMDTPAREVYDRLWFRVKERSLRYYEKYPGDVARVKQIVRYLLRQESIRKDDPKSRRFKATLPSGGILTARRFLQLGLALGGSPGSSFATLHSLINSVFLDGADDISEKDDGELSREFLKSMDVQQSFDDAPLYFLLHESIYADGPSFAPTGWAAHSSFENIIQSNPEFNYFLTSKSNNEDPTLFFGEMVFPWMAHGDFAGVSGHGMKSLSEALANKKDWLPLYDASNMRAALLGNRNSGIAPKSKAAAAVYYEDMYVDFDCSIKLVKRGMPMEGCKVWVTNEHQHSGLRDDGANIFKKLMGMAKGAVHVPS